MTTVLDSLEKRIHKATGPSDRIDRAIATVLDDGGDGQAAPSYTASVDACISLIRRLLPGWHWHVGHGPMGIIPYASMTRDDGPVHVEATAPTVPLALLGALIKALNNQ